MVPIRKLGLTAFIGLLFSTILLSQSSDAANGASPSTIVDRAPESDEHRGASASTTDRASLSGQGRETGIRWRPTLNQSGLLLSVSQGFRIVTQRETRDALNGPYFRDYFDSLRGMGGWRDGDPLITNYIGHPILGSTYMRIMTQNDPLGALQEFSFSNKCYWTRRLMAAGYSAAVSTVYELSPIGDAAIGNVGLDPATKGAVDLVITPTVGMGWNLTEDIVDEYVIRWVESRTGNVWINSLVRTWLNPTRSLGNLLRFRVPWKRDSRGNLTENYLAHGQRQDPQLSLVTSGPSP